ncbi:MAG: oligopeptide transporter, OPT family [Deltaproteobacteria bacterium]|nr:MAG: oligopeptide transporter, OPT family [Deltaproteobacteria bacterium]
MNDQKPSQVERAAGALPELTVRAVVIGLVLSVVMAAANVYLGLYAGMTVSASIPAAVVGMLILKGVFRSGSILEANQIQTAASAGESLAAGIIFTVPALLLIGAWKDFDLLTTTVIAFTGGLLGILFMIPMRRVFVKDNDELPYPEGVACAAVLKAGEGEGGENARDARNVVIGAAIGALFKFAVSYLGVIKGALHGAVAAASRIFYFGGDVSPALVGVGYIVRLNVAVLIFLGGAIGWLVFIPLLPDLEALLRSLHPSLGVPFHASGAPVDQAMAIWSSRIRYIGVGAMVVGGIESIVRVRGGLVRAITELRAQLSSAPGAIEETDRDISSKAIVGFSLLAIALIAATYFHFTGHISITLLTTVVMVVMAFFFVAVASYIVGLVGNSNSPVSGMTITAVLFTGGMVYLFGFSGMEGMLATLGVAAIVCCAACTSGDVCNDLKTGLLVGASPRRQQIMQIAGVAVASIVMAPVLEVLHEAYTIGSPELSAPQAGLFASLAKGFFGKGTLPWGMVGIGVTAGLVILAIDKVLERRGAAFRAHLMPVAVGIYLPFELSVPILLGGLIAHLQERGIPQEEREHRMQPGVLFASGIIAGESLVGVLIAILVSAGVSVHAFEFPAKELLTAAAAAVALWLFWRFSQPHAASKSKS